VGSDFFGSSYGTTVRREIESSDLATAVRFEGHVPYGPKLLDLYDRHDALVLPSFTEGFPQVLLEAMARGVPVVATSVGGVARLVRDGENGLLVDAGDVDSLADALERVIGQRTLAEGLASRGLDTARRFTRDVQVDAVASFLDRCFPDAPFVARQSGR
jgi:glycosyltransferase involved in cell wall biosynthesis